MTSRDVLDAEHALNLAQRDLERAEAQSMHYQWVLQPSADIVKAHDQWRADRAAAINASAARLAAAAARLASLVGRGS